MKESFTCIVVLNKQGVKQIQLYLFEIQPKKQQSNTTFQADVNQDYSV